MPAPGLPHPTGPTAEELKSCCAHAYSSDLVALLLGESYHPGGLQLTRRLADALMLRPGDRVLDVASGVGTSALLLADAYRAVVDGVDYSPRNVAQARASAVRLGLAVRGTDTGRARFGVGDAERLPFPDAVFDAVVCECALCTFPDKRAAAVEFARVLRAGGRVGITDVTADPERLPEELRGLGAWIACVADARPVEAYQELLRAAGLRIRRTERHDGCLRRMVDRIDARVRLVRMASPQLLSGTDLDPTSVSPGTLTRVLDAARAAIGRGDLGYCLLIAERPTANGDTARIRARPARASDSPSGAGPVWR